MTQFMYPKIKKARVQKHLCAFLYNFFDKSEGKKKSFDPKKLS